MSAGVGLLGSARRVLSTLLEIVQVRLDLAVTEFEIEKQRLFGALLLAVAALLSLGLGVVLTCAWLVVMAGETYRLHALAVLALLFLGAGAWALRAAQSRIHGSTAPFEASIAELARDRDSLRGDEGPSMSRPRPASTERGHG